MDFSYLAKGLLIGFSIAAPVGQIGILCIRRTLTDGRTAGFVSGLGAATADAFYGLIAAFGLTAVSAFLIGQQFWLRIFGGTFLCYLGIRIFFTLPRDIDDTPQPGTLTRAYSTTLFLTLTNPTTILSFLAIFAGAGLASATGDFAGGLAMVAGVFLGSAAWWLLLSGVVSLLRGKLNYRGLIWVNRGSGVLLFTFGVITLSSLFLL